MARKNYFLKELLAMKKTMLSYFERYASVFESDVSTHVNRKTFSSETGTPYSTGVALTWAQVALYT